MSRPTKLTRKMATLIVQMLRAGNTVAAAAAVAGIRRGTLYEWLKRGARAREAADSSGARIPAEERVFAAFSADVERALAEAECEAVTRIRSAKEWQASAWYLERRNPKAWGRKEQIRHVMDSEIEAFVDELQRSLDPETFEKVVNAISGLWDQEEAEVEPEG